MTEYIEFERVLNGIVKYLDREIYVGMNDWQKVLARVAVSRLIGNKDTLRDSIVNNPYLRTFAIINDEGMVDVEGLARDLKGQIAELGKVEISLPMFGTFKFREGDIDKLYRIIVYDSEE